MSAVSPNQPAKKPRTQPLDHTPAELATDETIEWADPQPRRSGGRTGLWLVTITATLLALGTGYLGWEQWQARQTALASLGKANTELLALTKQQAQTQQELSDQKKLVAEQKQRTEQDASEVSDLKAKLGAAEARLGELEAQSEALNEHLAEFKSLTKQFQRMIDSGKLQISFRRGRMIVELPAAVLFASGSAEISTEGKQALQDIAKILRKVPGKRFMVGGHTDDVPIKNSTTYTSNWALSSARAVTVTEELIQSGLRANHLVAAGYGEYDPIASNSTDKGRLKNRRIEIVLEPDLANLPNAIADLKPKAKPADAKKK
ncbi:MAG TPA: OmpA family protein [Polyangiales bacterium]|nr:OmpA family protein [Polyangiales bacterium]